MPETWKADEEHC